MAYSCSTETFFEDFECCISKFYFTFLQRLIETNGLKFDDMKRFYYKTVKTNKDDWCEHIKNFNSILSKIMYVYCNSTVIASSVVYHLSNILESTPALKKEILKLEDLYICSLGGGSVSDIMALCFLLNSIGHQENKIFNLHITVIDYESTWKDICDEVKNCLMFSFVVLKDFNFIVEDLMSEEDFSEELERSLEYANIIMIVKFMSEIDIQHKKKLYKLLKKVCSLSQPNSLLFVLDYPQFKTIQSTGGCIGKIPGHFMVYEESYHLYTLKDKTIQYLHSIYGYFLYKSIPNTCFNAYTRAFWKQPPKEVITNTVQLCSKHLKAYSKIKIENIIVPQLPCSAYKIKNINCKECLPLAENLDLLKQTWLNHQANYEAAKLKQKSKFEKWKTAFTKTTKKAGWNKDRINKAVLSIRDSCKKELTGYEILHKSSQKDWIEECFKIEEMFRSTCYETVDRWKDHYERKKQLEIEKHRNHIQRMLELLRNERQNV